jgi:hypothetical protein
MMNNLAKVLIAKIVLTIVAWCVPPLFFPRSVFLWLGFPEPTPLVFLRLLGMAYTALVVGYAFGLRDALKGQWPLGVVAMGLVSNGGACLLLAACGLAGAWAEWGVFARIFMWGSLLGTGAFTAGLILTGFLQPQPVEPRTPAVARSGR